MIREVCHRSLAGPEGIDVGLFGSRIAVMNGGQGGPPGGRWIVNFTDSPVQLATDWLEVSVADGICKDAAQVEPYPLLLPL